jgi:predicted HAD superfamily Cof-like phosphohydrolase
MFTKQLPSEVFRLQREFIQAMGGKLDFAWAAETLVTEEVKELREAFQKLELSDENIAEIFKELSDVIYVVAHCYNVMPIYASEIISAERNQKIQAILDEAAKLLYEVCQTLRIPLPLVLAAYERVHASNMSKLGEDGKPVYREDGKVTKGPNYTKPDMTPVVNAWKQFQRNEAEANQGAE